MELKSLGNLRAGEQDIQLKTAPGLKTVIKTTTQSGNTYSQPKTVLPPGKADIAIEVFSRQNKKVYASYYSAMVNPPLY